MSKSGAPLGIYTHSFRLYFYCVCSISVCCICSFIFCCRTGWWNKAVWRRRCRVVAGNCGVPGGGVRGPYAVAGLYVKHICRLMTRRPCLLAHASPRHADVISTSLWRHAETTYLADVVDWRTTAAIYRMHQKPVHSGVLLTNGSECFAVGLSVSQLKTFLSANPSHCSLSSSSSSGLTTRFPRLLLLLLAYLFLLFSFSVLQF